MSFDPLKESFAILAPAGGDAQPFRLLGPILNEKRLMHDCIHKLYRKAKPKARALLRCRRFYSVADMLFLFKTHVRSQFEWCYGAIFHAATSRLERFDTVQSSFLRHMELNKNRHTSSSISRLCSYAATSACSACSIKYVMEQHMSTSTCCFPKHLRAQSMGTARVPVDAGTTCSWWIYVMEHN